MPAHRIHLTSQLQTTKSNRWEFQYNAGMWACELECMRCMHEVYDSTTGNTRRCKRTTCYTLPYCWQHLVNNYHLRIGRTMLKNTQDRRLNFTGLFACDRDKGNNDIVFRKNDLIVTYVGEILNQHQLNELYPDEETAPYAFMMSNNKYVDGACVRGVGALANACLPKRNPGCITNATFSVSRTHYPTLVATKTIRNGEEILVSYGRSYFNVNSIHRPHKTTPASAYKKLNYKCNRR